MSSSVGPRIMDGGQIVPVFAGAIKNVGGAGDGAQAGGYVDLSGYKRVQVIFHANAGTGATADDLTFTFVQSTDNAGSTTANLAEIREVFHKAGADIEAVGEFVRATQAKSHQYATTSQGDLEAVYAFELTPDMLDDGYRYLRVDVAATTNARSVCGHYMLYAPVHGVEPAPSVID